MFKLIKSFKGLGVLVLLVVVMVVTIGAVSLHTNLWCYYPHSLKTRIAWAKLQASSYNDPVCHENCLYERQQYHSILNTGYYYQPEQLEKKIRNSLLDPNENENFKIEIIKMIDDLDINVSYLENYLKISSEEKFKLAVREYLEVDEVFEDDLKRNLRSNIGLEDKYDSLVFLSKLSDDLDNNLYQDLLISENDVQLRERILLNILYGSNGNNLSADIFQSLLNILSSPQERHQFRKLALFILAQNSSHNSELFLKTLEDLWPLEKDVFLQSYIFDYLDKYFPGKYQEPFLTAEDWQRYENKLDYN